jgi:hypothetical protein
MQGKCFVFFFLARIFLVECLNFIFLNGFCDFTIFDLKSTARGKHSGKHIHSFGKNLNVTYPWNQVESHSRKQKNLDWKHRRILLVLLFKRCFLKRCLNWNDPNNLPSYPIRCKMLGLSTLCNRKIMSDSMFIFDLVMGKIECNASLFYCKAHPR